MENITILFDCRPSRNFQFQGVCLIIFLLLLRISESFLPNQLSLPDERQNVDYSLSYITEQGILKAAASYFEDNPRPGSNFSFNDGELVNLDPLTPQVLFDAYYGGDVSSVRFEAAIYDVIDANTKISQSYSNIAFWHMNGEQINDGNRKLISLRTDILDILATNDSISADYSTVRMVMGQYLHILQKFYCNTNWIEEKGEVPYFDLGLTLFILPITPEDWESCSSCQIDPDDLTGGSCVDNLYYVSKPLKGQILTSGFLGGQDIEKREVSLAPPSWKLGKCSHGGIGDTSRTIRATGGINKETSDEYLSPHHFLHETAAKAAIAASMNFLDDMNNGIRWLVGDDIFAKIFNLGVGSSLTYCVDTTGSMADDIESAKTAAIDLARNKAGSNDSPQNYILVPFNDPEYGPVSSYDTIEDFVSAIEEISVYGGLDCPEMAFSAVKLALENSLPYSNIFVFTDAGAKDEHLESELNILADDKQIEINFLFSGDAYCSKADVFSHFDQFEQKDIFGAYTTIETIYDRVAENSGGEVYYGDPKDTAGIIDLETNAAPSSLLKFRVPSSSMGAIYDIPIDSTLKQFWVSVTGSASPPSLTFITPSGDLEPFNGPDGEIIVQTGNELVVSVKNPEYGVWKIQVEDNQEYKINVDGKSTFSFTYKFFEKDELSGKKFPIDGRPVVGKEVTLSIDVTNSNYVRTIDSVTLLDKDGKLIESFPLVKTSRDLFHVQFDFSPAKTSLVIGIKGLDKKNLEFHRIQPTLVTVEKCRLAFSPDLNTSGELYPGNPVELKFKLFNEANYSDTYTLGLSKDQAWLSFTISPTRINLLPKNNATVLVTLVTGPTTPVTATSTVTLTATGDSGSSNYLVMNMVVSQAPSPDLDREPPLCSIVWAENNCTGEQQDSRVCHLHWWSVGIEAIDHASGVSDVTVFSDEDAENKYIFYVEDISPGISNTPIKANYTSSCCQPTVAIWVYDMEGHTDVCNVNYLAYVKSMSTILPTESTNLYTTESRKTTKPAISRNTSLQMSSTASRSEEPTECLEDETTATTEPGKNESNKSLSRSEYLLILVSLTLVILFGVVGAIFICYKNIILKKYKDKVALSSSEQSMMSLSTFNVIEKA